MTEKWHNGFLRCGVVQCIEGQVGYSGEILTELNLDWTQLEKVKRSGLMFFLVGMTNIEVFCEIRECVSILLFLSNCKSVH